MEERNNHYTALNFIPEYIYQEAQNRAKKLPILENSHRGEEGNEIGCLGEIIAEEWMKSKGIYFTSQLNKTTHDYTVDSRIRIDVKTKDRKVILKKYYDNTVPLYNHEHQRPDYFLFVSLHCDQNMDKNNIRRFKKAYITGSIHFNEIDSVGIRFLKDEKDWRNGTEFWTDCLNVEMWQLIPLRETIEIFTGKRLTPSKPVSVNAPLIRTILSKIEQNKMASRPLPSI